MTIQEINKAIDFDTLKNKLSISDIPSSLLTAEQVMKAFNIDKKNVRFYVGADVGHAESFSAFVERPIDNNMNGSWINTVNPCTWMGDGGVVPSIIATRSGKIGASAFSDIRDHVKVAFKQLPDAVETTIESFEAMLCFMKSYYALLIKRERSPLTNSNHIVVISTPSNWPLHSKIIYQLMAISVGIPCIDVVYESEAAMHLANSSTDGISPVTEEELRIGILIIDIGSSTIDLTFRRKLEDGTIETFHDSFKLGASLIEKDSFRKIMSQYEDNKEFQEIISEFPFHAPQWIEFICRQLKEIYFRGKLAGDVCPSGEKKLALGSLYMATTANRFFHDVSINNETMEDTLTNMEVSIPFTDKNNNIFEEKGSYLYLLSKIVKFYLEKFDINSLSRIIFTGSASQMHFINQCVRDAIKATPKLKNQVGNIILSHDTKPAGSIAKGIAIMAAKSQDIQQVIKDVEPIIEAIINNFNSYTEQVNMINSIPGRYVFTGDDFSSVLLKPYFRAALKDSFSSDAWRGADDIVSTYKYRYNDVSWGKDLKSKIPELQQRNDGSPYDNTINFERIISFGATERFKKYFTYNINAHAYNKMQNILSLYDKILTTYIKKNFNNTFNLPLLEAPYFTYHTSISVPEFHIDMGYKFTLSFTAWLKGIDTYDYVKKRCEYFDKYASDTKDTIKNSVDNNVLTESLLSNVCNEFEAFAIVQLKERAKRLLTIAFNL